MITIVRFVRFMVVPVLLLALGACQHTAQEPYDYSKLRADDPHSVLIVLPVNRSVEVEAPQYFLSTISRPVAEKGYYVFPVNLVKRVMEEEGMSDADLVYNSDPTVLGELFGADSILYISIDEWTSKYIVLDTQTTVSFSYSLKSGHSGETLWESSSSIAYSPNQGNSNGGLIGLVVQAVAAAVEKASPNYIPLSRKANYWAVNATGKGLLPGPYHKDYGMTEEAPAEPVVN
ncbi:DUF799 family lipoprotein [Kiloniella laminariae]|uniref:DUF799 family lipoprotein n=1 Tax=Kiloniella laminariae TaxID=454162 RepID=A0ABT4LDI7_9PROT|nr:GNA1162 family protein [Kiloniella laminariae]MCZ4279154.1 DUF799 family lipoprotein [Kiloniella laminariae]